ncbi:MAG: HoxN/HupN/NixA family nickel/cobalt transporter [uncultured Solirubrobacterales bacterium]|uniref:Nickel/cobalt efflux system n=1 Tax=uncultured Solirubrobacterales bacterium TaxID=768556 RepID=A0A6J4SYA9_9ACTN|nr:MAG: HoxN/HupN/NixA family nickel/cobalt transporter [uncultured Solirubrobacterales bacterium]
MKGSLTPAEWRRGARLAVGIGALHLAGFGLLAITASQGFTLGTGAAFGFALGMTAYTLGARHAFDADHIAAIDNVTRKLMNDGQRPLSVGFFFALGHSTIVFALAALLAIGIRGLSGAVADDSSPLSQVTSTIGPTVAGAFLVVIGVLNLVVLVGIVRVFLRMRQGQYSEPQLEEQLNSRGFMNRFLGRATRAVKQPWHMYPVGLLFGLGFDTATEIALLATAGTAAAGALPLYAILSLPILFAAGMTLLDTLDGAFMNFAYGWAFLKPVRKVFYNITITSLSVLVALVIGPISLISVLSHELSLSDGVIGFVAGLELEYVGYVIVGLFVLIWVIALGVWRFGRIEEKWSAKLEQTESA